MNARPTARSLLVLGTVVLTGACSITASQGVAPLPGSPMALAALTAGNGPVSTAEPPPRPSVVRHARSEASMGRGGREPIPRPRPR